VIRIGCSGWSYRHWRGKLYPHDGSTRDWLDRYAAVFDTVEVNATFYRLPAVRTVEGWTARVPSGFTFAVKASRYLTHVKRLREVGDGLALLASRLEPMRRRGVLGPILWQLPPTLVRDDERLAAFVAGLPPGRHAFEPRHATWFTDEVYALLRARHVALVVAHRSPEPPTPWVATADWIYLRLHNGGGARGRYTTRELESWAERVTDWRGDVYVYFNNDWEGFAVDNARALARMVARAGRVVRAA
jgi:uncharacterized protein YecE (DUF72 family)